MTESLFARVGRSVVEFATNKTAEFLFPILVTIITGGGSAYFAWLSPAFTAYGPVVLWALALAGGLVGVFLYWVFCLALERRARSLFYSAQARPTEHINPLDRAFVKRRIRIGDLSDPIDRGIRDKVFTDCDLVGPANVFMYRDGHYDSVGFINCDLVVINRDVIYPQTLIPLERVSITGGRIINATIFMSPQTKQALGAAGAQANWLNQ